MKKSITVVALLAMLSGCMSPNRLVDGSTPPSAVNGYIGGVFSGWVAPVGDGANYAFVFVETKTGQTYTLPFFDPDDKGYRKEQVRLIEVPPGHYRFSHWASYRTGFKEVLAKSQQAPGGLGELDVSPSRVTFIGGYKVDDAYVNVSETKYVVMPRPVSAGEFSRWLAVSHPGYGVRQAQPSDTGR